MADMITRKLLLNPILAHFKRRHCDDTYVVDNRIDLLYLSIGIDLSGSLMDGGGRSEVNVDVFGDNGGIETWIASTTGEIFGSERTRRRLAEGLA